MDDEHFLDEIATYLEAHEPPYPALWSLADAGSADVANAAPLAELQDVVSFDAETTLAAVPAATSLSSSSSAWCSSSSSSEGTDDKKQRTQHLRHRREQTVRKGTRNASREKMQSELKQLRVQSVEYEQRVEALRLRQQAREARGPPSQEESLLLATWKRIAKRRFEERARAEAENARLKKRIAHQAALAQNMQHCMRQLTSVSSWSSTAPNHRDHIPANTGLYVSAEDVAIYDMLIGELDAAYLRLDQVFQENGLSSLQMSVSSTGTSQANMKTRLSDTGEDSLYIELVDTDVVPYEMNLAYNASWHCWELRHLAKNCVVYDHKPVNVSAYKTRIEIALNGESVSVDFLNVSRSYRETNRICCVWRGITKTDSHLPGVYIDETGWQVMEPVGNIDNPGDALSSTSMRAGTAVLACSQLQSKRFGGSPVSLGEPHVSPLADIVVSTYESDMLEMNTMMKKLLVQDTAATSASSEQIQVATM